MPFTTFGELSEFLTLGKSADAVCLELAAAIRRMRMVLCGSLPHCLKQNVTGRIAAPEGDGGCSVILVRG
jgi:hypothetical protein